MRTFTYWYASGQMASYKMPPLRPRYGYHAVTENAVVQIRFAHVSDNTQEYERDESSVPLAYVDVSIL